MRKRKKRVAAKRPSRKPIRKSRWPTGRRLGKDLRPKGARGRLPVRRTSRPKAAEPTTPSNFPAPPRPSFPSRMVRKGPEPIPLLKRMEEDFARHLSHPNVSVVIVNRNGADSLWHCLFALRTQNYPAHEIILVDNASSDSSVQFVKSNYPQIRVLECEEDLGFALGGNVGAKTATGDLVAFLSNDLVARPDWILQLVEEFRACWPKVGAVSSDLRTGKGEWETAGGSSTLNFLGLPVPGYFEDPRTLFHPEAHSFMYARFLASDGPFDPDYISLQSNVYLGWRLRSLDREVRRSSAARVFRGEGGGLATAPAWKSAFYRDRNRWLNLFLFYETGNLLKILPWLLLEAWGRLGIFLVTDLNGFLGRLFALAWLSTHPLTVLRKRRAVQERRKVSDRRVLRCMSGRVARDSGPFARALNFLSLLYCLAVGLEVMEFSTETRPEDRI